MTVEGSFRKRSSGITLRDRNVWAVARSILEKSGALAGAVKGEVHRALLDYNRRPEEALEDAKLLSFYDVYHRTIARMAELAIRTHGTSGCVLLDFHGFKNQPPYAPKKGFDLILGTANRAAIPDGNVDLALGAFLQDRGYSVFVPAEAPIDPSREDHLSGQFTTRHYSRSLGINTIQVEIAPWLRYGSVHATRRLAYVFGEFISNFFRA